MPAIGKLAVLVFSLSAVSGAAVHWEQGDMAVVEGTWTARYATRKGEPPDTGRIHLQFNSDNSNMGHTWPASALPGLNLGRDAENITLELRRDAGTIVLKGDVQSRRAFGLFDFKPNADFARQLGASSGRKPLTSERLLAMAVNDVSRAFLEQLQTLGYRDLDLDQLLAMRIHRVTPEFISELRSLGLNGLSQKDLVAARIHGVSPEFVNDLKKRGYGDTDFDDLVAFRIHGVTPDFIDEMAAVGYKDLPAKRLIEFRIHGVDAEFVKDLKDQGYTGLSARDLVDARIHGRRWMRRRGQ